MRRIALAETAPAGRRTTAVTAALAAILTLVLTAASLAPPAPAAGTAAPPGTADPAGDGTTAARAGQPWPGGRFDTATAGTAAYQHLRAFQRIADENGGIRSTGSPGYAASVDYAAGVLAAAGYRIRRQDVPYTDFQVDAESAEQVAPTNRRLRSLMLRYAPGTPADGFTAPLVVAPATSDTSGCAAADYDGLPVRGSIVLVRRGTCGYANQQKVVAGLGARAMLLYIDTPSPENIWRLHGFNSADYTIPVASVSEADAGLLAGDAARRPVRLRLTLRGHEVSGTTTNLLAESRGGRREHTVMAGAHLDGVTEAPALNDNASSVAALLVTAQRLAPYQHRVRNRLRFALWGAEELVVVGSDHYVAGLSQRERDDISLYLNFEMIAAPNFVRFVMDGDASDQPPGTPPGPPGSGAIEAVFRQYFDRAGLPHVTHNLRAVGSDHEAFMGAGIPVGGMNGGAFGVKTAAEAAVFGGQAGQLYDRCYHQPCDALPSINRRALDENVPGIAWVVARFAADVSDVEAGGGGTG
jgi:Peptidase family M28/PA domain